MVAHNLVGNLSLMESYDLDVTGHAVKNLIYIWTYVIMCCTGRHFPLK